MPATLNQLQEEEVRDGDVYDPLGPEPEFLFEVVDGLVVRKTVGAREIRIANLLSNLMTPIVASNRIGVVYIELGYDLPNTNHARRKPDVSVLPFDRWPAEREFPPGDFVPVAPDLAVEVISPHEKSRTTSRKIREYFQAGVRTVWVIYPETEQVHIFSSLKEIQILTREDTLTGEPVVPGFQIPVSKLFFPQATQS